MCPRPEWCWSAASSVAFGRAVISRSDSWFRAVLDLSDASLNAHHAPDRGADFGGLVVVGPWLASHRARACVPCTVADIAGLFFQSGTLGRLSLYRNSLEVTVRSYGFSVVQALWQCSSFQQCFWSVFCRQGRSLGRFGVEIDAALGRFVGLIVVRRLVVVLSCRVAAPVVVGWLAAMGGYEAWA